jgi:hypothetical protein
MFAPLSDQEKAAYQAIVGRCDRDRGLALARMHTDGKDEAVILRFQTLPSGAVEGRLLAVLIDEIPD